MAPKPFPVGQLSQPPSSGGSLQASWPGSLRPGPGMPHDQFSWSLHPHDDENRYMFPLGCGVSLKENYHVTQFKASETVEGCVTGKTSSAFIAWKEQMRCIPAVCQDGMGRTSGCGVCWDCIRGMAKVEGTKRGASPDLLPFRIGPWGNHPLNSSKRHALVSHCLCSSRLLLSLLLFTSLLSLLPWLCHSLWKAGSSISVLGRVGTEGT